MGADCVWRMDAKGVEMSWRRDEDGLKLFEKSGKPVRIVGTNTTFRSIEVCAKALKVSRRTAWSLLHGGIEGSDIELEFVESPD